MSNILYWLNIGSVLYQYGCAILGTHVIHFLETCSEV